MKKELLDYTPEELCKAADERRRLDWQNDIKPALTIYNSQLKQALLDFQISLKDCPEDNYWYPRTDKEDVSAQVGSLKKAVEHYLQIPKKQLDAEEVPAHSDTNSCTCSSEQIMAAGCTCGGK